MSTTLLSPGHHIPLSTRTHVGPNGYGCTDSAVVRAALPTPCHWKSESRGVAEPPSHTLLEAASRVETLAKMFKEHVWKGGGASER